MIKLTFPDGSVKEFSEGVTAMEVAEAISPSLKKKCIAAKIDDNLVDFNTKINGDAHIVFVTNDMPEAFEILNHSTAHLLAHAISLLYPGAHMGVGPSIEEGFYYDFDLGDVKLEPKDLVTIEKKMMELSNKDIPITHYDLSKEDARKLMANDPYKLELIDAVEGDSVHVYEEGGYYEICRGPHVLTTKKIRYFKLLSLAGAYWRGDSKNKMLTRIYGTSWFSEDKLKEHLQNLEDRKLRDHRKIGRELELFMFSDYGPGLPFWLPNGYTLRRTLEDLWLKIHRANGYMVINTPIMLSKELWLTSGHWDHYKEDMYITMVDDNEYAIKPMNCPGAILCYKNSLHSYKELPLRYAELGHVHRHEASGALNGLFRVRSFTQDDAHTMITPEQVGSEIANILKVYDKIYSIFGLDYSIELSTRPEDNYIGDIKVWDEAEEALKEACIATGHSFKINPGDGAFYGPKLDFKLRDSMNRIWQCGTIQLDMQLPGRFDCFYIDKDGNHQTPIMLHRACFGSLERFIGIILENYAGKLPLWLAPIQVRLIPVAPSAHNAYAEEVYKELLKAGIRVDIDNRDEKLGYRMREAQVKKIPLAIVIGDNEVNTHTVTYRKHGTNEQINASVSDLISYVLADYPNIYE